MNPRSDDYYIIDMRETRPSREINAYLPIDNSIIYIPTREYSAIIIRRIRTRDYN